MALALAVPVPQSMTAGCGAADCVWAGAWVVVVVARWWAVVAVVDLGLAVVVVVGAAVVVVVGARVVVVSGAAATGVVTGEVAGAASSITAGSDLVMAATPDWRVVVCGSLWTSAVRTPTPKSSGMAMVRSLRIFRPIRWGRPLSCCCSVQWARVTSEETQSGQSGTSLNPGCANLADITSATGELLAISLPP